MSDQAENLRQKLLRKHKEQSAKTLAIISGKGGVGKTNFALNFALSLCQENKKVLLLDLDIGMGNIDVLLGNTSKYSIINMLENNLSIYDIIELGPMTLSYVAGGSGHDHLFNVTKERFQYFLQQMETIFPRYDFILFDMGAGVTRESLNFILAVDECILVTTPEPTALTDAYSMMKHVLMEETIPFYLIINRVTSERQGILLINRLSNTAKRFLQQDIIPLGSIPDDQAVSDSVLVQRPFLLHKPKAKVSLVLKQITMQFLGEEVKKHTEKGFLSKFRRLFIER